LYNIKRKKYKTVCAELAFAKSPSTEWSWFCIELVIIFLYLLCRWIIAIFKECLIKSRNSHCLYRYQVTLIVLDYFFLSNNILKDNKKFWLKKLIKIGNRIGSVMVSVLASRAIDCRYESRSGQTKEYKIGICCFSAKNASLRRKSKDWLARNRNNMSEWSDISTRWLLLAHLAKGNMSFYHHVAPVVRRLSSVICLLFTF
jgi:uncharacterized membrane protein